MTKQYVFSAEEMSQIRNLLGKIINQCFAQAGWMGIIPDWISAEDLDLNRDREVTDALTGKTRILKRPTLREALEHHSQCVKKESEYFNQLCELFKD